MNAELLGLCARHGVPCVDYHTPLAAADGLTVQPGITRDGVHPNEIGYTRMARVIRPVLTAMLTKDSLRQVFEQLTLFIRRMPSLLHRFEQASIVINNADTDQTVSALFSEKRIERRLFAKTLFLGFA